MIIAMDGTASSGKSTLAKRLSKKLGFVYCNTGAIYRSLAIKAERVLGKSAYEKYNENDIYEAIKSADIKLGSTPSGEYFVSLDGEDVTIEANSSYISSVVANYSKIPMLREFARTLQHTIATANNSVVEGRDIGTVVFPNAEVKFFILASPEVRANRRYSDHIRKGENVSYEAILQDILERDRMDTEREISPLKPAEDSIIIENNGSDPDVVVDILVNHVNAYRLKAGL